MLLCLLVLTGCAPSQKNADAATAFRAALLESGGCTFVCRVTADFGETVQIFALDCAYDTARGAVDFTVLEPQSLAGITATVTDEGAAVTYDGMAMELGLLAGESVMPAAAPALAAVCWTDAPITAVGAENDRTRVTYERTLCGRRLTVDTWLENGLPISAQVCYNQQCILKLEFSEFQRNGRKEHNGLSETNMGGDFAR